MKMAVNIQVSNARVEFKRAAIQYFNIMVEDTKRGNPINLNCVVLGSAEEERDYTEEVWADWEVQEWGG